MNHKTGTVEKSKIWSKFEVRIAVLVLLVHLPLRYL